MGCAAALVSSVVSRGLSPRRGGGDHERIELQGLIRSVGHGGRVGRDLGRCEDHQPEMNA